jgi:hypothetical protein
VGIGGRYDSHPQFHEASAGLQLVGLPRLAGLTRLALHNCGCAPCPGAALESLRELRALALPHSCLLLLGGTPRLQLLTRLEELDLRHCEWLLLGGPAAEQLAGAPGPGPGAAVQGAQPALQMDPGAVQAWAEAAGEGELLLPPGLQALLLHGFAGPEPRTLGHLGGLTRLQPTSGHSLVAMGQQLAQGTAAFMCLRELCCSSARAEDLAALRLLPALTSLHCLEYEGDPQAVMVAGGSPACAASNQSGAGGGLGQLLCDPPAWLPLGALRAAGCTELGSVLTCCSDAADLSIPHPPHPPHAAPTPPACLAPAGLPQLQELLLEVVGSSGDAHLAFSPLAWPELRTLQLDGSELRLAALQLAQLQGLTRLVLGQECELVALDGLALPAGLLELEVRVEQEAVVVAGQEGERAGDAGAAGGQEDEASEGWAAAGRSEWLRLLAGLPQLQLLAAFHEELVPEEDLLRLLPRAKRLLLHCWRGPRGVGGWRRVCALLASCCPELEVLECRDGGAQCRRAAAGGLGVRQVEEEAC